MSCMERIRCGNMIFNNSRGPSICPKCGGQMFHQWDEQLDYERDLLEEKRDEH